MMRRVLTAILILVGLALVASDAFAYSIKVCAPIRPGVAGQTSFVGGSTATTYRTDSRGCVLINSDDLASAQSLGYNVESPYRTVVAKGLTAQGTVQLPAGAFIERIIVEEDSGAAPTNVRVGTTSAGTDVMSSSNLSASSIIVPESSLGTRAFSRTAPQTLYVGASSFGSSRLNFTIVYGFF